MRQSIRSRTFLPAALVALCLVALLTATPADAARVKQIRVGDHTDYTRIVLELDGPASYSLEQRPSGSGSELAVELQAGSDVRVLTSRSRLVESITVKPGTDRAVALVKLRSPGVNVKELVLKSPYRIVLDLSPSTRASATPAPKPVAAKPTPSPTAATPSRAAPAPAAKPEAAPSPEPKADVAAASGSAAAPERRAVARATVPATRQDEAASAPETTRETGAVEGAKAEPSAEATSGERRRQPETSPPSRRPPSAEAPAPEPGLFEKLGAGDPALGLTFAAGGVAFLLVAFLFLRRRSARMAREAAEAPWPPPGAEERPEFATATNTAAEVDEETGSPPPLFGDTTREPVPDPGVGDTAPDAAGPMGIPEAPLHAEPEVVAKEVASAQIEELERRIERLEARLADSLEARERLERQLAAHTEELRVQRAAIARTQRAVRAAVRGPEAEAVPGAGPMASPSPVPPRAPGRGKGE